MIFDSETIGGYNVQKYPWFSPLLVITAFNQLAKIYGSNVEAKREFRLAREMLEGAIALLGAYELDPSNKYFLQPNLQSGSPDIVAVKQTEAPNYPVVLEITQLEIVGMNDYSLTNDVVEFLMKTKLSYKKSYNSKTIIVCVVNKKIPVDRVKIAEELKSIKPQSIIYILGKIREDNNKWTIFSPYPKPTKFVIYSLSETVRKYHLPSPMKLHRGTTKQVSYEKTHPELTTVYDIFNIKESEVEKYKTT